MVLFPTGKKKTRTEGEQYVTLKSLKLWWEENPMEGMISEVFSINTTEYKKVRHMDKMSH
jgi:hypothetical protein